MNPFDDTSADFLILVNLENQHSLWPVFADIPHGWRQVACPLPHVEEIAWVYEIWTDMRTASLIAAID